MRIVVAGDGVMGFRIAEQLMDAHDVVLIGATKRDEARLDCLDVEALPGPITSPSILLAAFMLIGGTSFALLYRTLSQAPTAPMKDAEFRVVYTVAIIGVSGSAGSTPGR